MDDEPMWAADCVVVPTPSSAITIPETKNEFAIKGNALKLPWSQSSQRQHYKDLLSWSQRNNPRSSECRSRCNSDTDKIMARMDAMTLKMNAQYKELQSNAKKTKPDLDEDDIPMSREEKAKFMQTFRKTRFYNDYRDRDSNRDNWRSSGRNDYNRDNYRSNTDDKPYDLKKPIQRFYEISTINQRFCQRTFMDLKTQLETVAKNHQASIQNLETKFDSVPKKGGITVVTNENDELVPTRTITGWRVCIDYRKLNEATAKDHFPLLFMDQMLERLTVNKYLCFLDGFSGYFQIPIDPNDQEKTTFTCPFGTYAYRRMPFGLCNAPAIFQRCMLAIFHDMIEESGKVFMDNFSVFGNSFDTCINNLDKMLQCCKDAHLVLNWENVTSWSKKELCLDT
ncbi:reverse transcriptase domain-containing protein, partial [Tanacetum coccineum]